MKRLIFPIMLLFMLSLAYGLTFEEISGVSLTNTAGATDIHCTELNVKADTWRVVNITKAVLDESPKALISYVNGTVFNKTDFIGNTTIITGFYASAGEKILVCTDYEGTTGDRKHDNCAGNFPVNGTYIDFAQRYYSGDNTKNIGDTISFAGNDPNCWETIINVGLEQFISAGDTDSPIITYKSKTPADYDVFNVLGFSNITYTIIDISGINNNSPTLYYKANSTVRDWYYTVAGIRNNDFNKTLYTSNTSSDYHFLLDDNEILPATYNYDEEYIETNAHLTYSLNSNNEYIKVRFFNITNVTWGFLEFMINNSEAAGTQPLNIYYCNSSYISGNPSVSSVCTLYFSMPARTIYNHSHHANSYHQVVPFNIEDGSIGGIKVTPTSYILYRGRAGNNAYTGYYVPVYIYNDSSQYTTDNGATWLNLSGTLDSHIHQIDLENEEKFIFYVCANDTLDNSGCSSLTTDTFNFDGLPPNSPLITHPVNRTYNNTMIITHSFPETVGHISYFNITLLNSDFTINKVIISNNSNLTTYTWNTSASSNDNYYIRVEAVNNHSLSSFGFSRLFTIDNEQPSQVWTEPLITNTSTTTVNSSMTLSAVFSDNNIVFAYNVTVYDSNSDYFSSWSLTDIDLSSVAFIQNLTPDKLGTWTIISTVYDAHTGVLISDYKNEVINRGLLYDFTTVKYMNYKDNITIVDSSNALLLGVSTVKSYDRYLFSFVYDNTLVKDNYTWRKYEVRCSGLYLSENSKYNANFVCFDAEKWIDFESPDIKQTLIYNCGADCYEVQLYMKTTSDVTFQSIGELNVDTQTLTFEVEAAPLVPVNFLNLGYCPISTTAQSIMYIFLFGVLMVCWIFCKFILKIPMVTIVTGLGFIGFAISLFYCSNIVGIMMALMGIGIMGDAIL